MYKVLEFEGKTNDLLAIDEKNHLLMTRLVKVDLDDDPEETETIDVAITSVDNSDEHPLFNQLRNKEIKVTVEVND